MSLLALLLAAGCSRPTGVRVQLTLEEGAASPDHIELNVYDRFGGIAYSVPLAPRLPGDVLVLVSNDAEVVRVVGRGELGGQMVVSGLSAIQIEPGKELPLALLLSSTLPVDSDGDSVPDIIDDCPDTFDPDQTDVTGSPPGDACSPVANAGAADLGTLEKPDLTTVSPSNPPPDLAEPSPPDLMPVKPPTCGDGIVQTGEACDDGLLNSDDATLPARCTSVCRLRAGCGNLNGASGAQIDPATGHCYVSWPTLVNWATASRLCESRGGHLAVVTSAAENARIQTLAGTKDRWIGLKLDHGQAVRDRWVNGEPVSFTSYAAMEPNNGGGMDPEACGIFDAMRGTWDDRPCGFADTGDLAFSQTSTVGYICENECGNGVVDPGEGCDASGAGCTATCQTVRACNEAGAVSSQVNGHCYFMLPALLTFDQASLACPAGTHLATLDELAESEAAALAVGGDEAWIALRAAAAQGNYAWTVGTDVFNHRRYHGFLGTEPNDSTAPPLCARQTPSQGWKDRPCSATNFALCERE